MTKQIEAVYENGVLRPVEPIELPEGQGLDLILITRDAEQPAQKGKGDQELSVAREQLMHYAGAVDSGDPRSADNDRIDADLAREYAHTL